MFLPMSCTSPLTVASTTLPFAAAAPVASRSFSMNGSRYATAFFMTRALFTTCGRNILPAPNRSPTTFMPSINGPSMTSRGRASACRASSTSASTWSAMPCTRACESRSLTVPCRQARSSVRVVPVPLTVSAKRTMRSVASERRLKMMSSTWASSSGSMSS